MQRRYARRRWLDVNQISEQADHISATENVYSNSSVRQQLEHQWTSLSEPAVLPLTTDPTPEHMQRKKRPQARRLQRQLHHPEDIATMPDLQEKATNKMM